MGRNRGVGPLWRSAKALTMAVVTALFPFLFILDGIVHWRLSPVLPGLLLLLVAVIGLPFLLLEVFAREWRAAPVEARLHRIARVRTVSRVALGISAAWFLVWLGWWL
jgi:hypothetical protein